MTVAEQAWVQDSLSRLEQLETQKAQMESTGQIHNLAEIEEEIATLYEALEAVAQEAEQTQAANEPPAPAASPFGTPVPPPSAPTPFGAPTPFAEPAPFAAPASADPFAPMQPAAQVAPAPAIPAGHVPQTTLADYASDDYDEPAPKSKAPYIAVAALAIVGIGVGGFVMMGGGAAPAPAPAQPTDPAVISASAVPTDTQEPDAAKGGAADRTPGQVIKESTRKPNKRSKKNHRNNRRRNSRSDKPEGREIKIDKSRDPLAGAK